MASGGERSELPKAMHIVLPRKLLQFDPLIVARELYRIASGSSLLTESTFAQE